jgi:hypothetical protein
MSIKGGIICIMYLSTCDHSDDSFFDPLNNDESTGWGLPALIGGAFGWVLGKNIGISNDSGIASQEIESGNLDFSREEKEFISQLWRYEEEILKAWEKQDWVRLYLLTILAEKSLSSTWSKFIPAYATSLHTPGFAESIRSPIMKFCELCQEALKIEFDELIPLDIRQDLDGKSIYLDYDDMSLSVEGKRV